MPESAYEKRRGFGPCRVLGQVEREHTMNGRECPGSWDVLEFENGDLLFDCAECGVGHFGGAGYQELLALWEDDDE